jgi:hypothetical protein
LTTGEEKEKWRTRQGQNKLMVEEPTVVFWFKIEKEIFLPVNSQLGRKS